MNRYLIWSNEHRMWWRPNRSGYTRDIAQAGRYDKGDAIQICRLRDQVPEHPLPELPISEDDLCAILHPSVKALEKRAQDLAASFRDSATNPALAGPIMSAAERARLQHHEFMGGDATGNDDVA